MQIDQVNFCGKLWKTRNTQNKQGPGPNYFSNSQNYVKVNQQGHLIMRILKNNGQWRCSEIYLTESLGYGSYIFHVGRGHDDLDPNAVLGLFTYQVQQSNQDPINHKQIDIQIAQWSDPYGKNTQYVVQKKDQWLNQIQRFTPLIGTNKSIVHAFTWRPNQVFYQSYLTNNLNQVQNYIGKQSSHHQTQIKRWKHTSIIPKPQNQNVHINFWLNKGKQPMHNHDQTIQILKFKHKPDTGPYNIYRYHCEQKNGWRFMYSYKSNEQNGWTLDGIAFKVPSQGVNQKIPIFQYHYDQSKTYGGWRFLYSKSQEHQNQGWTLDGTKFFAFGQQKQNTVPIYQHKVMQNDGARFLLSQSEYCEGWQKVGIEFWAYPGDL